MATLVSKVDAAHAFSSAADPPVSPEMPVPLPASTSSKSSAFSLSTTATTTAAPRANASRPRNDAAAQHAAQGPSGGAARLPAPSLVATTISLIGRGLCKSRHAAEAKTSVDGNDVGEDVVAAIDASLARHRDRGLSPRDAFSSVEPEARKMLASALAAEKRDDESRAHNAQVRKREALFSIAGVCCLVFPILLIFDALTVTLPEDFRSVLAMGAQEDSLFGKTALYVSCNLLAH